MRPFNIGDMVVSKSFGTGVVIRIQIDEIKVYFANTADELLFDGDGFFLCSESVPDIKTIRNPRPGGKEARDIVKISAQYYKGIKNKRFRHLVFWGMSRGNATISSIEFAKNTDVYDIYQEQKSTLKVES